MTAYVSAAFGCVIALIWLDEIFDVPALLLGAPQTPVNWRESLFESAVIALLWAAVIRLNNKLFRRMRYLEGLLSVCASCKRIRRQDGSWQMFRRMRYLEGLLSVCASCKRIRRQDGSWQNVEAYIADRSDAEFTHGICPDCAERLYPDFNPYKNSATA